MGIKLQKNNVKIIFKQKSSVLRKVKQLGLQDGEWQYWSNGAGTMWILRLYAAAVNRLPAESLIGYNRG